MNFSKRFLSFASIGVAAAIALGGVVRAADTAMVGPSQLQNADADSSSWLVYGRNLAGHRYSPLTEIDTASVGALAVAWKKNLGPPVAMESTPLVSQGVMYVTTGNSTLYALDAKSGATKWKYVYPLPLDSLSRACCDTDNRGVTLSGNKVYLGTLDAHLIALDARTGKVAWNVNVAPNAQAYSITSPPLPVKNMVITGRATASIRRAVSSPHTTPVAESKCGAATRSPDPASQVTRRGRRPAPPSAAASRPGFRAPTMRSATPCIGVPEILIPIGTRAA